MLRETDFVGRVRFPEHEASGAAPTPAPQLTAAQNSAVDRIAGLGFPREMALAAYLACDMNEDVAANMMFDVDDGNP